MVISFVKKYNRLLSVSCCLGDMSLSFSCRVGEYFFVSFCLRVDFRSVVCRWVVVQRLVTLQKVFVPLIPMNLCTCIGFCPYQLGHPYRILCLPSRKWLKKMYGCFGIIIFVILILDIFSLFWMSFQQISGKNIPTYPPGKLWVGDSKQLFLRMALFISVNMTFSCSFVLPKIVHFFGSKLV